MNNLSESNKSIDVADLSWDILLFFSKVCSCDGLSIEIKDLYYTTLEISTQDCLMYMLRKCFALDITPLLLSYSESRVKLQFLTKNIYDQNGKFKVETKAALENNINCYLNFIELLIEFKGFTMEIHRDCGILFGFSRNEIKNFVEKCRNLPITIHKINFEANEKCTINFSMNLKIISDSIKSVEIINGNCINLLSPTSTPSKPVYSSKFPPMSTRKRKKNMDQNGGSAVKDVTETLNRCNTIDIKLSPCLNTDEKLSNSKPNLPQSLIKSKKIREKCVQELNNSV